MKKYFFCVCLCVCFLLSVSCAKKLPAETVSIKKADGTIVSVLAEFARTEAERDFGFMERKHIPDGTGMLFIFENDRLLSFWMKNTPTPLSIAYIDAQGTIRDILDMTPYSLAPVNSSVRVRYALEVPQGWFSRAGISVGDTVQLAALGLGE